MTDQPTLWPALAGPGMSADVSTPIGRFSVDLFNATSGRPMRPTISADPLAVPYLRHVYGAVGDPLLVDLVPMPRATLDDDGVVLVAISGGKDGLATAVMLRASGRTVEGFHVAGINRGYPDELEYAEAACQALGIPLTVTTVRVTGRRSGFIEMPTKNQVIAGLMADHLVARGRGNGLAMGVVRADVPETMNPVLNWSDNTTAVARWSDFLYGVLGLDWYTPLRHETESVAVLLYHDMLHLAHGCMAPLRYRARLVATNQRRFGADSLLPGRCGSCVKCCGEVLVMDALGAPVAPGLVAHSVDFLADRMATEHPDDPTGDPRDHYVDQAVVRKYREGA